MTLNALPLMPGFHNSPFEGKLRSLVISQSKKIITRTKRCSHSPVSWTLKTFGLPHFAKIVVHLKKAWIQIIQDQWYTKRYAVNSGKRRIRRSSWILVGGTLRNTHGHDCCNMTSAGHRSHWCRCIFLCALRIYNTHYSYDAVTDAVCKSS